MDIQKQIVDVDLSGAIAQTFNLLGRCTPNGPEQKRVRIHFNLLLTERERRLAMNNFIDNHMLSSVVPAGKMQP